MTALRHALHVYHESASQGQMLLQDESISCVLDCWLWVSLCQLAMARV